MYGHNGLGALETITRTVADSVNGFRGAADHIQSQQFRALVEQLAGDRERIRDELQGELNRRGGPSEPGQSTLGQLHQAWLDLKARLVGPDDRAVHAEVERGEDYLKEQFETVMSREAMDEDIRAILERAYHRICDGRDRVVELGPRLEVAECQVSNNLAAPPLR